MRHSETSPKKVVRMANYIKFYGPTKEELQSEFKIRQISMKHYLTEIKKTYPMVREIRYKIE